MTKDEIRRAQALLAVTIFENPFIPKNREPTEKQALFLAQDCPEALYGGAAGGGKMLALETPVPTPTGWTTMGDVRAGDQVLDERGRPCTVVVAHPVDPSPKSFRLVFDDGSVFDACADHLWLTFDVAAGTREIRDTWTIHRTLSNRHLVRAADGVDERRPRPWGGEHRIVACDPIEPRPMRCITVDSPSGLYLIGRTMVPTHNTDAALMAAAQFLPVPDYHAILIRKTYRQLRQQGGLIERALSWWGTENWNEQRHEFTFPHPYGPPSVLGFGSMDNENAKFHYDGAELDFIAVDELRHFSQSQYTYMLTRNRGKADVPRRLRGFTNPGAQWIRERFGIQRPSPANGHGRAMQRGPEGRIFVPAFLDENPHLLKADPIYIEKLMAQDPVTRAQMLEGDWWIQAGGNMFKIAGRDGTQPGCGFEVIPSSRLLPIDRYAAVLRIVDLAATEPSFANPDPDWLRAQLWALQDDGFYRCIDQASARIGPGYVEKWLEDLLKSDMRRHREIGWVLEREAGSEAKLWVEGIVRRFASQGLIPHSQIFIDRPTTDKVTRARDYASAVSRGLVSVVHAAWTEDWLDEHRVFPAPDRHDDQVDPGSAAMTWLPFYANKLKAERAAAAGERPEFERPD